MTYLINKLKLVATGIMALTFFMTVTLSSCGTNNQSADDTDAVEAEEHPTADAQAQDSTKMEEHPEGEGEEHPSDSTKATED